MIAPSFVERCVTWGLRMVYLGALTAVYGGSAALDGGITFQRDVIAVSVPIFFVLGVTQLVAHAWTHPRRREPCLLLAAGVLLWGIGSALLNLGAISLKNRAQFPDLVEPFFLLTLVTVTAAIWVDVRRPGRSSKSVWIETIILCAGAASVTGFILVIAPAVTGIERLDLLFSLLYPGIDLMIAGIIVAQVRRGQRRLTRGTWMLIIGCVLMAAGDTDVLIRFATGTFASTYPGSVVATTIFATGWILLITGMCEERPHKKRKVWSKPLRPVTLLIAGIVPLVLLVIRPDGDELRWYLVGPAAVALAGIGARMMMALREAELERDVAHRDELTGLPNRRAFTAAVTTALEDDDPIAVMMVDLDKFKTINDQYGHDVGDHVLRVVADRAATLLGDQALVARLGGDEFVVLLPAPADGAPHLLDQARYLRAAAHLPIHLNQMSRTATTSGVEPLVVGASIGITTSHPNDITHRTMLARADHAMYEAKGTTSGIVLYEPDPHELPRLDSNQ
ncbi:MAG: diguanylate cyclase domain-containing protein [Angustibacter sp.]